MKITITGGSANFNGVTFYSKNFQVDGVRLKTKPIVVNVKELPKFKKKYTDVLNEIPFVRGIWSIIEMIFINWRMSIAIVLVSYIINLITEYFKVSVTGELSTQTIISYLIQGFVIYFVFKNTNLAKYHAAEHMVVNTAEKGEELTLENILKQSRVHYGCGTNLVVFIFSLIGAMSLMKIRFMISFPIALSLGHEIFLIRNGVLSYLLKPFYWMGGLAQYFLFTAKPSKKHLEVAKASLEKLFELESRESD